MLTAILA